MRIVQTTDGGPIILRERSAYTPLVAVPVANQDGPGKISVVCGDQAGNLSDPFEVNFTLDTEDPPANLNWVRINADEAYTNGASVALTIQGIDDVNGSGIHRVAVTNGNIDCQTAQYVGFVSGDEPTEWYFLLGHCRLEMAKKPSVLAVMDRAGRTVAVQDSIILDTVPPQGNFIVGWKNFQFTNVRNARVI